MEDNKKLESLLKPGILDVVTEKLAAHEVDISKIAELSDYLGDERTAEIIKNASFDSLDGEAERELLKHLFPLLDEKSKTALFGKVIEGELDWRNLEMMMPYITYLHSQIEAAYVEGAINEEAYGWFKAAMAEDAKRRQAEIDAAK